MVGRHRFPGAPAAVSRGVLLQQRKMLGGQRGDLADRQHAYAVQGWTVGQSRHQAFSSGMSVEIESGLETVRGRAIAR